MSNDTFIILVYKRLKGEISDKETALLDDLLASSPEHQEMERNLRMDWELSGNYEPQIKWDDLDLEEEYAELQDRIKEDGVGTVQSIKSKKWMSYAAAFAALLLSCAWLFNEMYRDGKSEDLLFATTIENETKEIRLPDGTTITLNQNSTLRFPNKFEASKRKVELEGEAYFSVKADANKPFVIETPQTIVEVLGTSFNLEDYNSGRNPFVAVYSGKLEFTAKNKSIGKTEVPLGYKATLDLTNGYIKKDQTTHTNDNAWLSQRLSFIDTPMKDVVSDLEGHFGIDITLPISLEGCKYNNSSINLKAFGLEAILNNITSAYAWDLSKSSDNSYQIKGESCK